jgi:hypothetical protein
MHNIQHRRDNVYNFRSYGVIHVAIIDIYKLGRKAIFYEKKLSTVMTNNSLAKDHYW